MRILFITSTRIGDAVFSTGLLGHLIAQYPGARFTIACGAPAEGVFTRMPGLERLWVLRKRRFSLHWLGLWWHAVQRYWDLVVDLRGSAIAWLVPARSRAVKRGGRRPGHISLHLAEVLDLSPPPLPVAWWNEADAARVAKLVPEHFLAICPSANWPYKIWPAERFIALAGALDLPVVVLGGPGSTEAAITAPVLAGLPQAIDLVGQLTLPEAAALVSRAALFVGNDSGLTHLAAAAGAPTLALFGPTLADGYAPLGRQARWVLADAPEGRRDANVLESSVPMEALPVSRVLEAANAMLRPPA